MRRRISVLSLCLVTLVIALAVAGAWNWRMQQQRLKVAKLLTGGEPARAPPVLRHYGCTGCHTIPGLTDADGRVGPSLENLRERVYIAGRLPNDGKTLVRWIVAPQSFFPSAMPDSGIRESEARDAAAYLYSH